jgi:hypothetical protein
MMSMRQTPGWRMPAQMSAEAGPGRSCASYQRRWQKRRLVRQLRNPMLMLQIRPDAVISTGPPRLFALRSADSARAVWIDSIANAEGCLSGRRSENTPTSG